MTPREIALSLLNEYELCGKYVNLSLSSHRLDGVSREDRGFITALLYTAVEHKLTYDYYASAISKRGMDKIDLTTLNILRLGMAQLIGMDRVADHVAVNETVRLGRNKGERGFVNGVLRAAIRLRDTDSLPLPDRKKSEARYLSVAYSFPLTLTRRFIELYGEMTESLLSAFNSHSYTDLTVNTLKITRNELISLLSEQGIVAIPSPLSSKSIRIRGSVDPRALSGFSEGYFFVQDASCAASVDALGIEPGDSVVDVCACPGGKSFVAAIYATQTGSVTAFDIHESKLPLVTDGAKRLGLTNVRAETNDATKPKEELFYSFDRVICDVVCSGLGVIGKKPDLRYRELSSVDELPRLQLDILSASAKYLKLNGTLVYSTCTLNPDENEAVVRRFLSENADFEPVDFGVGGLRSEGGCLTLVPHIHNTDGFFIAKLRRRSK